MDKNTLSQYGWVVIVIIVLAIMIGLASPFGNFVKESIMSATGSLGQKVVGSLDAAGVDVDTVGNNKIEVPAHSNVASNVFMGHAASNKTTQGIVYRSAEYIAEEDNVFYDLMACDFDYFSVPSSIFAESFPDGGSVPVSAVMLDGTTINFELTQNNNGDWYYKNDTDAPYLSYGRGWSLKIRANAMYDGGSDGSIPSANYHYFRVECGMGSSTPFQSLTMLGKTVYFNCDVCTMLLATDTNTNATIIKDPEKVSRIIINYADGTQDVFNITEKDVQNDGDRRYAGVCGERQILFGDDILGYQVMLLKYPELDNNYKDDIFANVKTVDTFTVEEDGNMTTVKIADDATYIYGGPGD